MNSTKYDNKLGDYIEEGYKGHKEFIPTGAYSNALDNLVIACVDIFIITGHDEALIAKRARHPQADWWLFGGRMQTGESMTNSAERLLQDELGIVITPDRLNYLTTFSAAWKTRAHEPVENGTHTMSVVFSLCVTDDELQKIELNNEYVEKKTVALNKLSQDASVHPVLRQCASAYATRLL